MSKDEIFYDAAAINIDIRGSFQVHQTLDLNYFQGQPKTLRHIPTTSQYLSNIIFHIANIFHYTDYCSSNTFLPLMQPFPLDPHHQLQFISTHPSNHLADCLVTTHHQ